MVSFSDEEEESEDENSQILDSEEGRTPNPLLEGVSDRGEIGAGEGSIAVPGADGELKVDGVSPGGLSSHSEYYGGS